jgi:uncharacterized protein YndB with AHSA1/START domain
MADTYTVQRRRTMAAPADRIFLLVSNFQQWTRWSPWEEIDPDLERAYSGAESGVGATYAWSGNRKAGAGRMEIIAAEPDRQVQIDLEFLKPFKSRNTTTFDLTPVDDGATEVVWTMVGPRPLLMKVLGFVFNPEKLAGKDMEKGLAQLEETAKPTPAG